MGDFLVSSGFYVKCSDNPPNYSPLVLCKEVEEGGDIHWRLQTEDWRCMVLGRTEPGYFWSAFEDVFLLVLDGKGQAAEKIAHVDLGNRLFSKEVSHSSHGTGSVIPPGVSPLHLAKTKRRIRLG